MHALTASLALLSSAALDAALVTLEPQVKPYDAALSSWTKQEKPRPHENISLTVALRVDKEARDALEKVFWDVSDPRRPTYGAYKTVAEITTLLAMPASRVRVVKEYFEQAGAVVRVNANRDMLSLDMRASLAEAALSTSLHWFAHSTVAKATRVLRASEPYKLPAHIAQHVTLVGELLQFPRVNAPTVEDAHSDTSWPSECGHRCTGFVTPQVLSSRYRFPLSRNAGAAHGNSMAVAEFQGQYFAPSDLTAFSDACNVNASVASIVGHKGTSAGVEAELDIEYIKAVAQAVPLTVVNNPVYSLLKWTDEITGLAKSPLVHSVSYGNDEAQQASLEYMYTCNTAFMKAGVRGLSILFASGDQGVCGREGCGILRTKFHPDFPAASPYITAVGGTDFVEKGVIGDEQVWPDGGGGFSDTYGQPDYQAAFVAAYLASAEADLPPKSAWNSTGRGYPDVSALGGLKNAYCVATEGGFHGVAGTSASCPVVAGLIALLNGERLNAKKPPMGFLNPFLYQNAHAFHDITKGTNNAGGRYGFKAIAGWDAASGLGSPNYALLSAAAMGVTPGVVHA